MSRFVFGSYLTGCLGFSVTRTEGAAWTKMTSPSRYQKRLQPQPSTCSHAVTCSEISMMYCSGSGLNSQSHSSDWMTVATWPCKSSGLIGGAFSTRCCCSWSCRRKLLTTSRLRFFYQLQQARSDQLGPLGNHTDLSSGFIETPLQEIAFFEIEDLADFGGDRHLKLTDDLSRNRAHWNNLLPGKIIRFSCQEQFCTRSGSWLATLTLRGR